MKAAPDNVILVTPGDVPVGVAEKAAAHRHGMLHRAFSVFVVNSAGEWLIQRRARSKYHSGGLWSNTCCSHPRPGEAVEAAAHRRLAEEMGFDCALEPAFSFLYRVNLDGGMIEHEYDHVFVGVHDALPDPDPGEVEAWRWVGIDDLERELAGTPGAFTYWFRVAFDEMRVRGWATTGPPVSVP